MSSNKKFPGFPQKPITNFWSYPKVMNGWWSALTGSEQKCLDYILRHTWGYDKSQDYISLSQFRDGITKKDGTQLDTGTGLRNDKTIRNAIQGLVDKGYVLREYEKGTLRGNLFTLKTNPYQEMVPPPKVGRGELPKDGGSSPSQEMVPTIDNSSIDKDNTPAKQGPSKSKSFKKEISEAIGFLSKSLGDVKFPNYGKQARYAKSMLASSYSMDDIQWAIKKMANDPWWKEHSFDMKNVADEIPKLMTRTYKVKND